MYNVEKYIQRCLFSIINNKGFLENCELIVVNDGTKDNSESIARKIIEGLPNTQIIVQENQGLSAARNTGLSRAIGEYVWFIDSDDWIEPDAIKSLMNEIDKNMIEGLETAIGKASADIAQLSNDARKIMKTNN